MKRIVLAVFWLTLTAFLLLGAGIVFGQLAGVLTGSGAWVTGAAALLNWPAFTLATVCSLAAFVLGYFPSEKKFQDEPE